MKEEIKARREAAEKKENGDTTMILPPSTLEHLNDGTIVSTSGQSPLSLSLNG